MGPSPVQRKRLYGLSVLGVLQIIGLFSEPILGEKEGPTARNG
jgi:hypothetical protein